MKRLLLTFLLTIYIQPPAHASNAFETYGNLGQYAIPAIAAGISWYQDDIDGLKQFSYSLAATGASVWALKNTVDSQRPNGEEKSFPSGHSALAFSGASYLQMRYGWTYGIPAYAAAGLVGWSRVDTEQHYWRDVIAGAVIATSFSYLFTDTKEQQVAFYPTFMGSDAKGIAISYYF
jgi:membrane-associated phospholipid phosphatase